MNGADEKKNILDGIGKPEDLRSLSDAELDTLAGEIREKLVNIITSEDGSAEADTLLPIWGLLSLQ